MKKLLVLMLVSIFLISLVSAFETAPQNKAYEYAETVSNADQCNLTQITYPDKNSEDLNLEMDKEGFRFVTNISSGNFTQIGDTCWDIICYDADADPQYVSDTKCVTVNGSGLSGNLGFYIIMLLVIGGIIVLGFGIKEEWFVVFGGLGLIMLGIYSINYGIAGFRDMFMTWGLGLFEIGIGATLSIGAAWEKLA